MPIVSNSASFHPPYFQFNGHLQSIIPGVFREVKNVQYERERFILSDGDFLDLDWIKKENQNLVILTHGLEGNSNRQYVKGMAKMFSQKNWDVLAWHCRSCSGEMNLKFRLYNHGEIGDIGEVINHALQTKDYQKVVLIGFSMGGNISMKYLGVHGKNIPPQIKKCVAFSAPCDLKSGAEILNNPTNKIYRDRFLRKLKAKIEYKASLFPGKIDLNNFKKIKVWRDFDELFSAPLNGFSSADAFYEYASAKNFMPGITIPTLLVNAQNDPILTPECSPKNICEKHPFIHLENPKKGGHCGFMLANDTFSWSEYRAWQFVKGEGHK
ncbi:MAG: alpha/beta fold hydrolase [Bacteroidetes bacterium]|jgi:predicted alpha/beta-fold hydrolase|nr:alpha/beta fold hydrolase [Bacteroidota bacterium]MDF1864620.1 alpha/beta fold hydrolase [Saprospiraceae bacterium]